MDSQRTRKSKNAPRQQTNGEKLKEVLTIKRPNKGKKVNSLSVDKDKKTDGGIKRGRHQSSLPKAKTMNSSDDKNRDFKRQTSLKATTINYADFEKEKKKVLEEIELNNDIVQKFGEKLRQRRESTRDSEINENEKAKEINSVEKLPLVTQKRSSTTSSISTSSSSTSTSSSSNESQLILNNKYDKNGDCKTKTSKLQRSSVIKEETFVFDTTSIYRKSANNSTKFNKTSESKTKTKCADFKRQYSLPKKNEDTKVKNLDKVKSTPKGSRSDLEGKRNYNENFNKTFDKPVLTPQLSYESEIEKSINDSLENLDTSSLSEDYLNKVEEFRKLANSEIDKSLEQIRQSCQELDNLDSVYKTETSAKKTKSKFNEYLDKRASAFGRLESDTCETKREEYDFGDNSLSDDDFFVEASNKEDPADQLVIYEMLIKRRSLSVDEKQKSNSSNNLSRLENLVEDCSESDLVFAEENEFESRQIFVNFNDFTLNPDSKCDSGIANSVESLHTFASFTDYNDDIKEDANYEYGNLKRSKSLSHLQEGDAEHVYEDIADLQQTIIKDKEGNIRIEAPNRQLPSSKKPKLNYIIEELKTSEEQYIKNLDKIVNVYKPYVEKHSPKHLIGKACYLFGNIEKVFYEEKLFYEDLLKCEADPSKIAEAFLNHANLFKMYPKYFKNKATADTYINEFRKILKEMQIKFNDKLELNAYLLTPIQRLGKFPLLLENMATELEKVQQPNTKISEAITLVKKEMLNGNDQIAIDSITNCPIPLVEYGPYRMKDTFQCVKPKRGTMCVFLFEKIIVLTIPSQKTSEKYQYEDSILFSDLSVKLGEDDTTEIELYNFAKSRKCQEKHSYQLKARNIAVKNAWYAVIESKLWQQVAEVKKNVLKMYSTNYEGRRDLIKSSSSYEKNPRRLRSSSTFYVN